MFNFADGNGNLFIITAKTLEYKPVTPTLSSSGIYSGGEYIKKEITPSQYNQIKKKIETVLANRSIHIKNRIMGSGQITIVGKNDKKTRYLIQPNSDELIRLEELLREIIA